MSNLSAGTVTLGVSPDTTGFGSKLKSDLMGHTKGVGEGIGGLIKTGLETMAGPIAAVTAAFSVKHVLEDSMKAFEDYAGQVKSTQRLIGGSVEDVSQLTGAFKLVGLTLGAGSGGSEGTNVTSAMQKFSVNLGKAAGDASKTAEMTKLLGTSFTDAHHNVLPMSDLLPKVADKFASMPDGAEKTALAVQLFGRAGAQMLPMLNKGAEGMKELEDKAKSSGLVLDDLSMRIFSEAKESSRNFAASIQGLKVSLGQDLLPVVDSVQNVFRNALAPVMAEMAKWLTAHREGFLKLGETIGEFGKKGMEYLGDVMKPVGEAFKSLAPTFEALMPQVLALSSSLSPLHLVFEALKPVLPAIVQTVADLAKTLGGTLGSVLKEILPPITEVVQVLTTALSGIMVQLMPSITELAKVLGSALGEVIKDIAPLVVDLVKAIASLLPPILPLIPQIINLAISAIMPLAKAITPLLKELLPPIIDLFRSMLPVLMPLASFIEKVLVVAIQLIVDVVKFLIPIIDDIIIGFAKFYAKIVEVAAAVGKWFYDLEGTILKAVGNALGWLLDVGKNIVEGLLNGIKSAWDGLTGWLGDAVGNLVSGTKKALGIHSPSTVFYDIGGNITDGLANGINDGGITALNSIRDLGNEIKNHFADSISEMPKSIDAVWATMQQRVTANTQAIVDNFKTIIGTGLSSVLDSGAMLQQVNGQTWQYDPSTGALGLYTPRDTSNDTISGSGWNVTQETNDRNALLHQLLAAGVPEGQAWATVDAQFGGDLQTKLDKEFNQTTLVNPLTNQSMTMGGDLSGDYTQNLIAAAKAFGYQNYEDTQAAKSTTINYFAAPNDSLDSDQKLQDAIHYAKVTGML